MEATTVGGDQRFGREPAKETTAPPTAAAMSIADPAPLGLAAFALTTFVLSFFNVGIVSDAVGLYLIAWGIFTTYRLIASLRTTAAVSLVFLLLAITFIVL